MISRFIIVRVADDARHIALTGHIARIQAVLNRHSDTAAVYRSADNAAEAAVRARADDRAVVDAVHDFHRQICVARRRLKSADDTADIDNAGDSAVVDAVLDRDIYVLRDTENTAGAGVLRIFAFNRAVVDTVLDDNAAADGTPNDTGNAAGARQDLTADGDVLDRDIARYIADKTPAVGCLRGLNVEPLDLGVGAVCLLDADEAARESSGSVTNRGLTGLAGHIDIILKNDILVPQRCVAHQRQQIFRRRQMDLAVCLRHCKRRCAHNEGEHAEQHAEGQNQTQDFLLHSSLL